MINKPNPGSKEAIKRGCRCPSMDNHYGKGFEIDGNTCYYINESCKIHGDKNRAKV